MFWLAAVSMCVSVKLQFTARMKHTNAVIDTVIQER